MKCVAAPAAATHKLSRQGQTPAVGTAPSTSARAAMCWLEWAAEAAPRAKACATRQGPGCLPCACLVPALCLPSACPVPAQCLPAPVLRSKPAVFGATSVKIGGRWVLLPALPWHRGGLGDATPHRAGTRELGRHAHRNHSPAAITISRAGR